MSSTDKNDKSTNHRASTLDSSAASSPQPSTSQQSSSDSPPAQSIEAAAAAATRAEVQLGDSLVQSLDPFACESRQQLLPTDCNLNSLVRNSCNCSISTNSNHNNDNNNNNNACGLSQSEAQRCSVVPAEQLSSSSSSPSSQRCANRRGQLLEREFGADYSLGCDEVVCTFKSNPASANHCKAQQGSRKSSAPIAALLAKLSISKSAQNNRERPSEQSGCCCFCKRSGGQQPIPSGTDPEAQRLWFGRQSEQLGNYSACSQQRQRVVGSLKNTKGLVVCCANSCGIKRSNARCCCTIGQRESIKSNERGTAMTTRGGGGGGGAVSGPSASMGLIPAYFIAELMGTFLLVVIGDGAIAAYVLTRRPLDVFCACFAFGVGAMIATFASARISGAHINPAASLAFALDGRLKWRLVPVYLAAQYIGGFLAALVLFLNYSEAIEALDNGQRSAFGGTNSTGAIFATYPASYVSAWGALLDQVVGTALLLFALSAITDKTNHELEDKHQPVVVAFVIGIICVAFSPNCGAIFNPARDLAPRLLTAVFGYPSVWAPIEGSYWLLAGVVGPHIGAIIGVFGYKYTIGWALEAHQRHAQQQQQCLRDDHMHNDTIGDKHQRLTAMTLNRH